MRLPRKSYWSADLRPGVLLARSRRREEADAWVGGLANSASAPRRLRNQSAFTLVEIALCIAIIGFALVAIIGVLPAGLNVQKENREETIIVHDANFFMDAIRSGARGLDDLTNYVETITNYVTYYNASLVPGPVETRGYTYTQSVTNSAAGPSILLRGSNIVGLLSTPKYIFPVNKPYRPAPVPQGFFSNYVVAYVRALSGAAVEKVPQNNVIVRDLAFRYRLICELSAYSNWNTNWVDFNAPGLTPEEVVARSNYWQIARGLQGNMNEIRLIFRWPVDSRRVAGNQRLVFRTLVGGSLVNEPNPSEFWFMRPDTYQYPQ